MTKRLTFTLLALIALVSTELLATMIQTSLLP